MDIEVVKRVRSLPNDVILPNHCPTCGDFIGVCGASEYKWLRVGNEYLGFCCMKCLRDYERKVKVKIVSHETF